MELNKKNSINNILEESRIFTPSKEFSSQANIGNLNILKELKDDAKKDPIKSIVLSVKDLAYNPSIKAIIAFSNSGKTAKLVSAMRPRVKIITISPNINVSRQMSLLWGVQSLNSRDANGWRDMMNISKEIIKKDSSIKKNDFVVITAGLPFGNAGMTNMIRLYKVGA